MPIPSWPQIGGIRKYLHFVTMTPWRNGSASDSRSEGCVFKSRRGQNFLKSLYHSKVEKKRTEKNSENTFVSCMRNPKMWNASRFCVSSLRRGHANLLCIVPILVYVQPKLYNLWSIFCDLALHCMTLLWVLKRGTHLLEVQTFHEVRNTVRIGARKNWYLSEGDISTKNEVSSVTGLEPAIPRSEVWCLIH